MDTGDADVVAAALLRSPIQRSMAATAPSRFDGAEADAEDVMENAGGTQTATFHMSFFTSLGFDNRPSK